MSSAQMIFITRSGGRSTLAYQLLDIQPVVGVLDTLTCLVIEGV